MKEIFSIKDDFVDTRLDRWFKKTICKAPQSLIEKNIRKGNIRVNKRKEKSSYRLQKNDEVLISIFNLSSNFNF